MAQIEPQPNADATQRVPASTEPQIRLVFDRFQAFVDEYRPKISLGGFFLESSQPHPVGTRVSCEFQLTDGFRLCRAVGEVAWRRPTAGGPDRPAGMGVRFLALDDQGRELILKILEEQVKGGGEPFEVERVPADVVTESSPPEPREDPASTHPRQPPPQGPREDPASTHSRPAVVVPSALGSVGQAVAESVEPGVSAAAPPQTETAAPGADEFGAPWGQELPALPDDVIGSPLDADALATAYEDFDSDLSEAGFVSDKELLGLEAAELAVAPDEISFSDEALDEEAPTPSLDIPSFDTPSFEAPSLEAEAFGPAEPAVPDFDDVDVPLTAEPVEAGLGISDVDALIGDAGDLDSSISEWPEPVDADDEEPISHFGLPEPPSSGASSWSPAADDDRAWEGDDGDAEWEEEGESGLRSVWHRTQITLAESSGRFILILVLLVTVGAALIFKERILTWVGLGSPAAREVSAAPLTDPEKGRLPPTEEREPAAASQEPADLESAPSSGRPELIEVGAETTAETATAPPAPELRPPPVETAVANDEPPTSGVQDGRPATRVERITFDQAAEGTRVTVWLDGDLAAGRYDYQELSYDPRKEQLVISGIGTSFASTIDVGTLELDRIRTGLHAGNRLNLVFDLSSEHMTLAEIRSREDRLEILVRRR